MAMLGRDALQALGFAALGRDVQVSDRASFHGAQRIALGDRTRIDDFCLLSAGDGGIEIGAHVHVAAYTSLIGAGRIRVADFANLSSRVSVYSSSDDYSGRTMTNPTVPDAFKDVTSAPVFIGRHAIIGCGAVVLPGVRLEDGVAVGALSLVNRDCEAFGVYAGVPARRIKDRSRELLQLERRFLRTCPG
ncbi:MAG: acyltransferase [Rubrivivax sp.]|jgi:acetyltransferase-like isoleucine patch superfamily enzyme